MLEGVFVLLVLVVLMVGAVGILMIKDRLPLTREAPQQGAKEQVPDRHPHENMLPYYVDSKGDQVHLAFASEEHMPKVMIYQPTAGSVERYDCHEGILQQGEEVIRWPNPLRRKIESLCEDCITFPNT